MLLWAVLEPDRLSANLRDVLEDSGNSLFVSAASTWEIATKWRPGKLSLAESVVRHYGMALNGLAASEIPISGDVSRQAGLWELPHRDPVDRLLAAQAVASELVLASGHAVFSPFEAVVQLS